MKVTTQEFEDGQAILNIEVESEELEKSQEQAYRQVSKKINVPGFRKGKVPRHVLENFVGADALKQEALEHLLPDLCQQAAKEKELDVIAQPQIEVIEEDPVVFKATYPLRPKVELGDYHSLKLELERVEVKETAIDDVIQNLREQAAIWEPVDRAIAFGDMATIDIEQRLEDQEPLQYEGQQLPVIQGSPLPLPGFCEQLEGMQKGEEKEFVLEFPEDHENNRLAGMKYDFKVKVTEVKEKSLPDVDDEFVKSLGRELDSLEDLRKSIAEGLQKSTEEKVRREFEQKAVNALKEISKIEYPPILLDQEVDLMLRERDVMMRSQGGIEAYMQSFDKTEEDIREELRPHAAERLAQRLIMSKLAEEEKIEVTSADIDGEIERETQTADPSMTGYLDLLKSPQGRRSIHDDLRIRRALDRLVTLTAVPAEESAKAEEDTGEIKAEGGEEEEKENETRGTGETEA